jgi:dephospho-CoA kinase
VIGLVGAIGAGKSTVARCFQRRGGLVIDADALGHAALENAEVAGKILSRWGDRVRKNDGSLDRRAIAQIVFALPEERSVLEAMVFPVIGEKCREILMRAQLDPNCRFVVLDAAVMLEAGWKDVADRIVYVDAPRDLRLGRVAARSGWSDAELAAREQSQWPAETKMTHAEAILTNHAEVEDLQNQVDHLLAGWGLLGEAVPKGSGVP